MRPGAAMIHLVGPDMLLEILRRIEHGSGFQQRDVDAQIGEHLDHRAAAGARPDHHHIVHLRDCAGSGTLVPNITPGAGFPVSDQLNTSAA